LLCRFEKKRSLLAACFPRPLALAGPLPWLAGYGLCWLAAGALAGWPWLAGHSCLGLLAVAMAAMYSYR